MIKIAVVGGRDFNNVKFFNKVLDNYVKNLEDYAIISGGAKGADTLADLYAESKGKELIVIYPEWGKYGKRAGYIRNTEIWRQADCGIAFWDGNSKGTAHSIELAKKFNKDLTIVLYKKEDLL